jgi:Flp pilus assembly protein TadD
MEEVTIDRAMQIASEYYQAGKLEEAERVCRQILAVQPRHAGALNLLGTLSYHAGYNDVAIELIRRAVAIDPAVSAYHSNLGNLLRVTGHVDDAITVYQAALVLTPDMGEIHSNLASALAEKGRLEEAIASYHRAIELRPKLVEAYSNLGNVLTDQGKIDEAIAAYRIALSLKPDHAEVHCNLGMCLLLQGDYAPGWREYEWRWKCGDASEPSSRFSQPLWDGGDLAGRTILLHAEQGFGDTIQFIRYARLVANRGGKVIVECQRELIGLLSQLSCVGAWVAYGESLPAFDVHYPLLSLPLAFGTTLESIPSYGERLRVPADRVKLGRQLVAGDWSGKWRVGLVWKGSAEHKNDRHRSIPVSLLSALGVAENVRFFSLQKTAGEKRVALPAGMEVVDRTAELRDFADTAALIEQLDLVISVDTAVAHLAAAMGKAVWVLLPFSPDWRWQLGRADSPWYPTMRLFRQRRPGAWGDVIDEVAAALSTLSA